MSLPQVLSMVPTELPLRAVLALLVPTMDLLLVYMDGNRLNMRVLLDRLVKQEFVMLLPPRVVIVPVRLMNLLTSSGFPLGLRFVLPHRPPPYITMEMLATNGSAHLPLLMALVLTRFRRRLDPPLSLLTRPATLAKTFLEV